LILDDFVNYPLKFLVMENTITNARKITIADIAEKSGVSSTTVSLVLRDKPGIGQKTRQRVLDSAQGLGYLFTSSKINHQLSGVSSIGLIIKVRPNDEPFTNHFYAPVLAGIEAFCRRRQINLLYAHMPVDEDNNLLETPRLLLEQHADGLLVVGVWLNESTLPVLQQHEAPIVLVDAYTTTTDLFDAVITNNERGAYQAVSFFIDKGHRNIAIVGSLPNSYPSIQERRNGYIRALADHNLHPHFVDCHLSPNEAVPATIEYLNHHPDITAIFSCNDEVAIGIMAALQSQGRCLPESMSIIGFDNIALAQHVTPTLTTMRVDKMGMGRLAAQLLVNRIENPQAGTVRAVIRASLIERESVRLLGKL
jgi:LacI family transcriptional regulator